MFFHSTYDAGTYVTHVGILVSPTQMYHAATYFISDEEKEYIAHLKNSGKEVDAVKKVREITSMDLVQAKQYVDTL